MGFDKLAAPLAGYPVLRHSLKAFADFESVTEIVVVGRQDDLGGLESMLAGVAAGKRFCAVGGGAERHLSVWNGLQALSGSGFVAIHDGARPLVTREAIAGSLELARIHGAACCAAPIPDTVKRADGSGMVTGSVDRAGLWAMQTPQIFRRDLIEEAYRGLMKEGQLVTDEVSAVERMGGRVALYANPDWNFKITYPADIERAEQVLAMRQRGEGTGAAE